jgi:hypothetical protein
MLNALRLLFCVAVLASPAALSADVITFEDLPDAYFFLSGGQNIGNYYSGATFGPYVTGLSASRFGGYGDAAYPPHSGDVVVWSAFDDPMTLAFDSPESLVSFWYTSLNPITLTAYDSSSNPLGFVLGAANTDGTTGTSSYLEFDGSGIASVAISSAPGQYVIDDLTFSSGGSTTVPEPNSIILLVAALAILWVLRLTRCGSHLKEG